MEKRDSFEGLAEIAPFLSHVKSLLKSGTETRQGKEFKKRGYGQSERLLASLEGEKEHANGRNNNLEDAFFKVNTFY